jgi:hypothetical protein
VLFVGGYSLQWISEAVTAPQLDLHEDERLNSNIQTLTTPQLMFRTLLTKDGAQRFELVRI